MSQAHPFRREIAIDTEAQLAATADSQKLDSEEMRPAVPRIVCGTWYTENDFSDHGIADRGLLLGADFCRLVYRLLSDTSVVLIIHNASFDMAVIIEGCHRIGIDLVRLVFDAYSTERIKCTFVREALIAMASEGRDYGLSLDACVKRYTGADIGADKKSGVRTSYGPLETVPLSRWPDEHKRYALDDPLWHWKVYAAQDRYVYSRGVEYYLKPEADETRAAFAFALISAYGCLIDVERQAAMRRYCEAAKARFAPELMAAGILRADGTKDTKRLHEIVEAAYAQLGEEPERTPTGMIKTEGKKIKRLLHLSVEAASFELRILQVYLRWSKANHTLNNYLSYKRVIHARFTTILKNSRTSSSPNIQNPPRNGLDCMICDLPARDRESDAQQCPRCGAPVYDVRANYIASPGCVILSGDFPALEMRTWAQVMSHMLGSAKAAEYINAGIDPHLLMAAELNGISYEEAVHRKDSGDKQIKRDRQASKPVNFGRMGGLQPKGMVDYSQGYEVYMSVTEATAKVAAWNRLYSDAATYFAMINRIPGIRDSRAEVIHPITGMVRGRCWFTAAANFLFSQLAQRGCKYVLWLILFECYCDPASPLYGCRVFNFVHDEYLIECVDNPARRTAAARRLVELMLSGMGQFITVVPVGDVKAVATRVWAKEAEPRFDSAGVLQITG